jgi:hypothetical protein
MGVLGKASSRETSEIELLRLFVIVFFMALGATVALATEPLFPPNLKSWVDKGQVAVSGAADPDGQGVAASAVAEPAWTVPTGLVTVKDVAPKVPTGCGLADCPPSPLLTKATGELRFSLQVTPLALAPDVSYAVVLSARDGHVYDSVQVSWSREDLVGIDPAERSVIKRKETEARHNRRVELKAPYDDVSIPPFIEDYNQVIGTAVDAYKAGKAREFAMDPMAAPIVAALFPDSFESPDEQASVVDQAAIDRIVDEHFILELVEAGVFTARLLADPAPRSRLGPPRP